MIELHRAGAMNFLRTLLILLCIYYGFKFLAKLLAPYLMKKAVDKMQKKAAEHYKNNNYEQQVNEGETVIDKKPIKEDKKNNSVGEYVDFEEID